MTTRRIVNITDCIDIAANELRAAALRFAEFDPNVVVEPTVPILPAFSVINANFAVRLMADAYPEGTVLWTTINAEKERPKNVIGRTENGLIFLGRNMGSFDWLTRDFGCAELYDFSAQAAASERFRSFEGKQTTAQIAARAARGIPLADLGTPLDVGSIVRLKIPDGTIVHIDNFGMMKFTGDMGDVAEGDRFEVSVNGMTIEAVFGRRLMSFDSGTWVLFPGSSFGLYELGCARSLGAVNLGTSVGDILTWSRP